MITIVFIYSFVAFLVFVGFSFRAGRTYTEALKFALLWPLTFIKFLRSLREDKEEDPNLNTNPDKPNT